MRQKHDRVQVRNIGNILLTGKHFPGIILLKLIGLKAQSLPLVPEIILPLPNKPLTNAPGLRQIPHRLRMPLHNLIKYLLDILKWSANLAFVVQEELVVFGLLHDADLVALGRFVWGHELLWTRLFCVPFYHGQKTTIFEWEVHVAADEEFVLEVHVVTLFWYFCHFAELVHV